MQLDERPRPPDPASLDAEPLEPRSRAADVGLALVVVTGYLSPVIAIGFWWVFALFLGALPAVSLLGGLGAIAAWVALVSAAVRDIRAHGAERYRKASDVLVLLILPLWGLALAYAVPSEDCSVSSCEMQIFRPFAFPEVFWLLGLHALLSIAYLVSRRRPHALSPRGEVLVNACLVTGMAVHATVALQLGPWLGAGLVAPPILFCTLAPVLTIVIFYRELAARLRRRGREARLALLRRSAQVVYRNAEPGATEVPLEVHRPLLARALALSPVLLALHALVQAAWRGHPLGALDVFTRTCGHTLSQVPIVVVPEECHYLCTVAARGHRFLVRPERVGKRGGVPILVNRQLAIANAFEDLLHERWPRFGRWARRTYDRFGLPVSRYIRSPWAADAVYLAMKPFEWCFALALLLLDRRDPERRIDRMYR